MCMLLVSHSLDWVQVLDALAEIAFDPEFLVSRIEKERRAVLAEAQMMNTIEYRVDCQLLQYLHEENALGCRFPIGKTAQACLPRRSSCAVLCCVHALPGTGCSVCMHTCAVQSSPQGGGHARLGVCPCDLHRAHAK